MTKETYNAAIFKFDFIPQESPISFTYIFGSEKYQEYVNAGYNDIFAFFVSGPNPSGGNYNNVNIALIPGTTIPVSIDNVNSGSYSQYYINNDGFPSQPVFDGFTTPLTAQLNVIPCQTYHMKIAIADAGDGIFDSGVFLKRNSLSTSAVDLAINYSNGSAPAVEGCSNATITVSTATPPSSNLTISWNIQGTATNGIDCNTIPNSLTIPAGQTSTNFTVTPTVDEINEGTEYLVLIRTDACGNTQYDTIYFYDNTPLSVNAGQDQTLCLTAMPAILTATPIGGSPPYVYQWNNGAGNTQSVQVSPGTTHYMVTVTDACNQTATDVVDVIVIPNPTSSFIATTPICVGETVTVTYTGNASYNATYNWNFNGATILSGGTGQGPHQITWYNPGTYTISLSVNEGGCSSNVSEQAITVYNLNSPQCCTMPTPNAGTDKTVCGLSTTLQAYPSTNGTWTSIPPTANISQPTNPNSLVSVPNEGTYLFVWTESTSATCTNSDTVAITFYQIPIVNAGTGGTICSHSFQLNGSVNVGISTWTASPAMGVSFANINSPITNVSVQNDGTYTFTLTANNNGCINSSQVTVSFYEQPVAFAGNDDNVCSLNYTLNGSITVGIGTWTATGPGNINFINGINNPHSEIIASNTGTYTLILTANHQGCIDKDTVILSLTQPPTSSFKVDTINCFGNQIFVTFNGIADPISIFTWNWDGGNVQPGTGIGPHVISWTTPGLHTISLTVSTNGCQSQPTTLQVYNPEPLSSTVSKTNVLCHGEHTGSIDLSVTGGRLPYSYHWNNGSNTQDLINIAAGIYTVTITDASGCTTVNGVEIKQPPALMASVTPSQYICIGQPAYLTITATGGTGPYQYYWNGQLSNPAIVVFPEVTTTYTASVVDANGCQTGILTTTVYVAPPLNVNILANTDSVCPGDPVMLTPVIWGGVGPPYIIYNQDGEVISPPVYVYPQQSGWYGVRVEDGCGSWDTSTVFIYVWPLPPANILADTLQGCVPLTVHFIEINPDSGQTYVWNFGDQSNLSLSKNPVHTYTSSGTFDVTITVTSQHGCKNTVVYNDLITVWPKPNTSFIWSPEVATEIDPIIQFTNLTTGASWYQWIFGDGDSSSVVHPVHRYPGKGEYEVQLVGVSNRGCLDTSRAIIKILEQYTFYAPTAFSPDGDRINDYFYIIAHGIKAEGFLLEIYDRWGEVIWKTEVYDKTAERSERWDGRVKNGDIAPVGVYTWRCVFRDNFNRSHEEIGSINLIR